MGTVAHLQNEDERPMVVPGVRWSEKSTVAYKKQTRAKRPLLTSNDHASVTRLSD